MNDNQPNSYEYDVFISYSTVDKAWVRGELLKRLKNAGLKVCIDCYDFQAGAAAIGEIERGIKTSRKILMVLTPNYMTSQWTKFERYLPQTDDPNNEKLVLLPLLKENCDLPLSIKYLSYVNFTDPEELDIAWRQVFRAFGIVEGEVKPPQEATPKQWFLKHPYGMPPHFTGRIAEREMLNDWLKDTPHPLLGLQALGGFGKSALSWHWLLNDVAERDWPSVVWWSFYEAKAGFDNFVYETLTYLTGREPQDLKPPERVARLLDYLRRQRVLLVLDGFERELRAYSNFGAAYQGDGEPVITDNGRDCVNPDAELFLRSLCNLPKLRGKVLMSTRLRPRPVEVNGGALLIGCREEVLTQMQAADAVEFFRAQGIRGNWGEIEQACGAYGFHPLSLRLLAGLVVKDLRSPGDIQAAQRKDLTGSLVHRQNHVLAQSYESLTVEARQLLSRMACFRSPVAFDVLESLVEENFDLETDLQDLMERGLVQREATQFDLHPIVRRYAYDRMGTEERRNTHGQLRDYFAAVPAVERVTTIDDLAPMIELYHHMVRAGQYDEACDLFHERLHTPLYFQLGAYQQQIELLRTLFSQGEAQPPQLQKEGDQTWTLNALANSYSLSGQPAQAVPLFTASKEIDAKQDDKKGVAITLGNLAAQQLTIGNLQAAEDNLLSQIAICQDMENGYIVAAVGYQQLGRLLAYRGNWTQAEQELDKALEVFEEKKRIQDQSVTWAFRSLRALLWARSHKPSDHKRSDLASMALTAAKKVIELADETARTHHPVERDYVRAHWLLGSAHRLAPDLPASDHHLTKALHRCRAINMVDTEANILLDLARLRRDQRDLPEARRRAEEARTIATRSGYVLQGADIHLFLAELSMESGDGDAARELAQEALRLATCDGGEYVYRVAYDEAVALLGVLGD
jgi:tetratricopeptide (TPR) repeat protein